MTTTNAPLVPDQGLEILVELAKTGQIDPWNVDLVTVADHYLAEVERLQSSDLRLTGKTLLYLAILLRMKSDLLAGLDPLAQEDPFFQDESFLLDDMDGLGGSGLKTVKPFKVLRLDDVLRRRTSTKQKRIRQVTLEELVAELKKYESFERAREIRERLLNEENRRQDFVDFSHYTVEDIADMAHDENLEDAVESLSLVLHDVFLADPSPLTFDTVCQKASLDPITCFLALLFLEARGELQMTQTEFYSSDIFVAPETATDQGSPDLLEEEAA